MELDRCECCGTVNLQWIDHSASELYRHLASALYHEGKYPVIRGRSMAPYTYDLPPLPESPVPSVFLAGPSSESLWRPEAIFLLRNAGFRGRIVIPEFSSGVFDKSRFDDGEASSIPGMSRSSERIMAWETAGIDHSTVLLIWAAYTPFDDERKWTGLSTRSEASRAIATHEGRRKLVMGMPQDACRSGQERCHAHINGVEIHPTLEQTCAAAMLRLGERPPPGSTPSKRPEGSR